MSPKKSGKVKICVCMDSKCKDKDAKKVRKRLEALVEERDAGDAVKVKKVDCIGDCSKAPIVELRPGKTQFRKVGVSDAESIVDAAVKRGQRDSA